MTHNQQIHQITRQIEAYRLLYESENRMRVAMHSFLAANFGLNYRIADLFPRFEYSLGAKKQVIDLAEHVKRRKQNERDYNLVAGFEFPVFWYIDFPILNILLDQFWDKYFSKLFIDGVNVRNELLERMRKLSHVRNSIAHMRYISDIDYKDLESFVEILNRYQQDEYLRNYDALTLTSAEMLRFSIESALHEVSNMIDQRKIVEKQWRTALSLIGAHIQARREDHDLQNALSVLSEKMSKYNELSRKPGKSDIIRKYVEQNQMEEAISRVIERVKQL